MKRTTINIAQLRTKVLGLLNLAQQEKPPDILIKGKMLAYNEILDYLDSLSENDEDSKYFESIAVGLRELWPAGEKDGIYPWRDSVSNLVKRLKVLWDNRNLYEKHYSVDDVLQAGRRYLAQYETNAKYMQILKYFIWKNKSIFKSDGSSAIVQESKLADFLETNPKAESISEEDMVSLVEQGEIV